MNMENDNKTWQGGALMNKDEILSKSRKELKNVDLVEQEAAYQGGRISAGVAACLCVIISILSRLMTGEYLVSPWIIYFSIMGTNWLVRFIKLRKKSDLLISLIFIAITLSLFVVQIIQFMGA